MRLRCLIAGLLLASTSHAQDVAAPQRAALRTPAAVFWTTPAPDSTIIELTTSKGVIAIMLYRAWAPAGVDRMYNLTRAGFFDDSRFYRVVATYIAQFGLAGNPIIAQRWRNQRIRADSVRTTNARGTLTFAQTSPRNRSTDLFINLRDNPKLDTLGFAPIGKVIEGMDVADQLFFGYGDLPSSAPPTGNPRRFYGEANRYLDKEFPKLDRIITVRVRQ
jgi:peptidyl-prolyl cis-trans isomerase A (cyclophilin A)